MIESCPRRRMLLGTSLLALLTIIVLIIESTWTDNVSRSRKTYPIENNSTCWQKEKYEIIQDCHPCTDFEIASQTIGVCIHTHFKEVLKCLSTGETVTRSCDRSAFIDSRNFWRFEFFTFIFATLSTIYVYARKRRLDKLVMQRVQRQLANSV